MAENKDSSKELVVVICDWQLASISCHTIGMCNVDVSPPFQAYSVKKGFPLTNATNLRVSLFSVMIGLEIANEIIDRDEEGRLFVSVVVKDKKVLDILRDEKLRNWAMYPGEESRKVVGYRKSFIIRLYSYVDRLECEHRGYVTLSEEKSENKNLNFDIDTNEVLEKCKVSMDDEEETNKRLQAVKNKDQIHKEFIESGVFITRGSKRNKQLFNSQKLNIAKNEIKK
jgi:hypothetical protein